MLRDHIADVRLTHANRDVYEPSDVRNLVNMLNVVI